MATQRGYKKVDCGGTLGGTAVILTDKTGTLTMAKMELSKVLPTANVEEK